MKEFFITFLVFGTVIIAMAVGVIFGRKAIQGSCGGGAGGGSCVCTKKCDKRKKVEAEALKNSSTSNLSGER